MSHQQISKKLKNSKQTERRVERRKVRREIDDAGRSFHCRRAEDVDDLEMMRQRQQEAILFSPETVEP